MSESGLPTGTATFLFTDLEGSTRLWEGHPDEMVGALERHDELLSDAVAGHRGHVVKTTGDGVFAVFAAAPDAAAAALDAQCQLDAAPWPGTGPLHVRMGLHTGRAQLRDRDYHGHELNRAARIMNAAWGGQVLCSAATATELADRLPPSVQLIELQRHRLKDLSEPELLFQLQHASLRSDFPPVRSLSVFRHNLPIAPTAFVGREEELEHLRRTLSHARLLSIVGTGGLGKTRLAIELASRTLESHPDGVWLCDLTTLRDDDEVPYCAAAATRMATGAGEPPATLVERLCDHLLRKRVLLVLDNCEHVLAGVGQLVSALLARCGALTIITTSRHAIGVPGETVWRAPPLSPPQAGIADAGAAAASDAVRLFCDRARDADSHFALDTENVADVIRICELADGIPLALELAAGQVPRLGLRRVAQRVEDSFLLGVDRSVTTTRHGTLGDVIGASFALIEPAERRLLARASVFRSAFALDAATALTPGVGDGDEQDVDLLLAGLVDSSLVVLEAADDGTRYRLLEPIRQFARERLVEDAGLDEARASHARFFQQLALSWGLTFVSVERDRRVAADEPDFRSALEWCHGRGDAEGMLDLVAVLWPQWYFAGREDACEWPERVLTAVGPTDLPMSCVVKCECAVSLANSGGDVERVRSLLLEADEQAHRLDHPQLVAFTSFMTAEILLAQGDWERASVLLEEALGVFEAAGETVSAALCHDHLGWVAVRRGEYERARRELRVAADLAITNGASAHAAAALSGLAPLLAVDGERGRASEVVDRSLELARDSAPAPQVMALLGAIEVALLAEDVDRAESHLFDLLSILHDLGVDRWVAEALELVALVSEARGTADRAALLFGACDAVRRASRSDGQERVIRAASAAARRRTRQRLGEDEFTRTLAQGEAASPDDLLAAALDDLLAHR